MRGSHHLPTYLNGREKLKIIPTVMDQLVQGANGDMRQVLNMMSTWKLSKDAMDFDEGKQLCACLSVYFDPSPITITVPLQMRSTPS
jgi:replication factor C subunit 1